MWDNVQGSVRVSWLDGEARVTKRARVVKVARVTKVIRVARVEMVARVTKVMRVARVEKMARVAGMVSREGFRRGSRGGEMGEFSPPPPLFLSPLLSFFFIIPQILK